MPSTYVTEMDNLIVDLDKVLDDFEAEEKASSHFPGQELKPSDFANYVAEKEDKPWEDLSKAPYSSDPTWKLYSNNDKLSTLDYDAPYSPTDFDLSEADFAPSVSTNQKTFFKDSCKNENFVAPELNNHISLNHNGVVENFQHNIDNKYKSKDKTSLQKGHEYDFRNSDEVKSNASNAGVIHSGSELNGVTLDHNITGHVPNSFGTASGNSQKDIKYVHLLASYTDETGCKFPIQARDEFTPVYENQPFPPDLAPALQNRESVHTQLHQIFENSSETYMNDKQQNHKEILMAENNISGKSDLLSAIPGNLYLNSNDSSIDSGLNSMDGQTCASFDTALVNSSQTRPIQNQETKVAVKAPHSYLSNVVTPHSQTGANEKSEQMDTNNKSNLCASNEPEVMDDQTDVKCVSDTTSQMTKDSHNSKGNVVEFGDIGYPVRKEMDDSRGNSEGSEDVTSPMTRGNSDSMVEFVRTGDKTLSVMKDIVDSSVKVEENKSSEVAKDICDSKVDMVGFGDEASSATTEISVVGFGDVNIEVSDTDIDNYLSDAVKDNQNDHKDANIMNEKDEVMCNEEMTCNNVDGGEHGYPPLSEMRGDSGHSIGPNHGYCVEPAGQVRTNLHNLPQASEQSHDKTASENEQVKDNQTEVLNIIRPKEAVRPNSLSQPSADSLSSNNTAADSKQGHVSPMEFFDINQSRNESSNINDSEQSEVNISNAELSHVPSASTTEPAKSRQTLAVTEEDMDEDLAAAIALSLKETTNMPSNIEVSNGSSAAQIDDDISDKEDIPVMRRSQLDPKLSTQNPEANRPHSWGPSGSGTASVQQQKRPNSLNLPPRGEFSMGTERSQAPYTFPYTTTEDQKLTDDSADSVENTLVPDVVEDSMAAQPGEVEEASGASGNTPSPNASLPDSAPPSVLHINTSLGKVAPVWIPDSDAPICMGCDSKFTFTKRRHHCRACGKVFCSACCNLKSRLQYMENKEARVCHSCHEELTIVEISSRTGRSPNPNNPSEYCSTIPPTQQVSAQSPPPTVMVPVGVLKREGSHRRGEPKQVMFSDGIRPGGDLTELDGSNEATSRIPHRRSGRSQKKVDRASPESGSRPITRRLKATENQRTKCLIPETGLPPLVLPGSGKGEFVLEDNPDLEKLMPQIKDEEAEPVIFALNTNLQVLVKILSLDCCVNRLCWCFTSKGMCTVGQDEIVIVLETLPDETTIPKDIFCHLHTIYDEAGKGNTVSDMGHTIFNQSFLDSRDHGGFLYIRPTFQCLHKLILPTPPYVFGILLQKWETPWAKVFPIRLLLRLGAEYRYYPCPLISVRNRKPVFFEIGHTIMNLLADFRNYQYMLPQIKGITIHMEDKKTVINFPRNRYDDLMKVVSNSNEHVMAVGAGFSTEADSHLVCIQNDDGNYQTQAINIQNKPRKVTGASFVVFNGALKTSSGLKAKSSIVEDGLMVQISPESMVALKQAMKDMKEYEIGCGSITLSNPDEVVLVQWTREDKNINVGVKSPIDNMAMDGIESIHIPNATDYVGEQKVIRWTDVFFIQNLDSGSTKWEPVDLSRLAETLSNASCIALTQHLQKLKEESLTKIGLRVNIETDKVGYEIGSNGEKLPDIYMNDLDNELIPVIHSAASQNHGGSICLELIFHILD